MISEEDQGRDGLGNLSNVDKNLEEGSGDPDENVIPDFVKDVNKKPQDFAYEFCSGWNCNKFNGTIKKNVVIGVVVCKI